MDALIFQKDPHGGIARMYRELLPRMADLEPKLEITLVNDGPLHGEIPHHERIRRLSLPPVRPTLRPKGAARTLLYPLRRGLGRLWDSVRQTRLGDGGGAIWHSTYYTYPERWSGPQVVCLHDLIPENHPRFFADPLDDVGRQRKRRCIENATAVVCVSAETLRLALIHYDLSRDRLAVIHHAAAPTFRRLDAYASLSPVVPTEPYFLYVGGRAAYKNFDLLLSAFAGWNRSLDFRLAVVGGPWSREEQMRLRVLGVEARVVRIEDVDDDTLCQLYNRARALVFPSLEEGFGLPLVEAMACGCPIVASRIPSTIEIAGDIPVYFEIDDEAGCRAGLDLVLDETRFSDRTARGLVQAGRYSWDAAARAWLDVYSRAVTKTAER